MKFMADPYGRHHTAIVVKWSACIRLMHETRRHSPRSPPSFRIVYIYNPFLYRIRQLSHLCSTISHEVPSQILFDEFKWNTFIWLLPPHTKWLCMLCCCCFLIFAWYRLITYPCPYDLSIIESRIFPCFIIVIFTAVISMEMIKHGQKYIYKRVCVCLKYNSNRTRSFFGILFVWLLQWFRLIWTKCKALEIIVHTRINYCYCWTFFFISRSAPFIPSLS